MFHTRAENYDFGLQSNQKNPSFASKKHKVITRADHRINTIIRVYLNTTCISISHCPSAGSWKQCIAAMQWARINEHTVPASTCALASNSNMCIYNTKRFDPESTQSHGRSTLLLSRDSCIRISCLCVHVVHGKTLVLTQHTRTQINVHFTRRHIAPSSHRANSKQLREKKQEKKKDNKRKLFIYMFSVLKRSDRDKHALLRAFQFIHPYARVRLNENRQNQTDFPDMREHFWMYRRERMKK